MLLFSDNDSMPDSEYLTDWDSINYTFSLFSRSITHLTDECKEFMFEDNNYGIWLLFTFDRTRNIKYSVFAFSIFMSISCLII